MSCGERTAVPVLVADHGRPVPPPQPCPSADMCPTDSSLPASPKSNGPSARLQFETAAYAVPARKASCHRQMSDQNLSTTPQYRGARQSDVSLGIIDYYLHDPSLTADYTIRTFDFARPRDQLPRSANVVRSSNCITHGRKKQARIPSAQRSPPRDHRTVDVRYSLFPVKRMSPLMPSLPYAHARAPAPPSSYERTISESTSTAYVPSHPPPTPTAATIISASSSPRKQSTASSLRSRNDSLLSTRLPSGAPRTPSTTNASFPRPASSSSTTSSSSSTLVPSPSRAVPASALSSRLEIKLQALQSTEADRMDPAPVQLSNTNRVTLTSSSRMSWDSTVSTSHLRANLRWKEKFTNFGRKCRRAFLCSAE